MTILFKEGATQQMEDDAEMVLGVLNVAYPGHPWGVRVMEGGFFIQYLLVPFRRPYGMFCKTREVDYSASAMKREIILMAGEWLERAGMARGPLDADQEIVSVEGVPLKHQERTLIDPASFVVKAHDDEGTSLRETAHRTH